MIAATDQAFIESDVVDERANGISPTAKPARLSLKEIRIALGEAYKPIITVDEASTLSRLAVKTLQRKVSEGLFKSCVKRGRPLLFWTDRFLQELMR